MSSCKFEKNDSYTYSTCKTLGKLKTSVIRVLFGLVHKCDVALRLLLFTEINIK